MSLTLVTPPELEPVTLAEMKLQCGLGPMEDADQLSEQLIAEQLRPAIEAARQQCESICARAFLTQTWQMTLDHFPRYDAKYVVGNPLDIQIPLPTFQGITEFNYLGADGTSQQMGGSGNWGYQLVSGDDRRMARLRPPAFRGWPITQRETVDAVTIQFTCGFGAALTDVPYAIRNAVKVLAQWIYGGSKGKQPEAVVALLTPYIIDIV